MFAPTEDGAAKQVAVLGKAEQVSRLDSPPRKRPETIDLLAERYFLATTIVLIVA
jgi:hypothetical protein